jgi:hypothetical protein
MVLDSIFDAIESSGGRFLLHGQTDDRRLVVLGRSEAISTIQHVLQEFIAPSSTATNRAQTSALVSVDTPSTIAAAVLPISDTMAPLENEDVSCQELDVVFGDPRRTHYAGNRRLEGTSHRYLVTH